MGEGEVDQGGGGEEPRALPAAAEGAAAGEEAMEEDHEAQQAHGEGDEAGGEEEPFLEDRNSLGEERAMRQANREIAQIEFVLPEDITLMWDDGKIKFAGKCANCHKLIKARAMPAFAVATGASAVSRWKAGPAGSRAVSAAAWWFDVLLRVLGTSWGAAQQARADELQAQLAEARQELARAEQAAQDGQQKCRPLERELREGNQASGAGTDGIRGGEQGGDGTDPRVAC